MVKTAGRTPGACWRRGLLVDGSLENADTVKRRFRSSALLRGHKFLSRKLVRAMRRLIFGCGYLGAYVARRWQAQGDEVFAVTRSAERAERLAQRGLRTIVADVTNPSTLDELPEVDVTLYAVGRDRSSPHSMHEVYVDGLKAVLQSLENRTARFIYISSTSVYGQTDGGWVDENSPCEPAGENGRICLEAENALRESPLAERSVILRLAGIYGPGRLPNRHALVSGEPIAASLEGYLNLIHVDDAAEVSAVAADHSRPSSLYLVSDGRPMMRREYYAEAARLLSAPPPQFTDPREESPKQLRAATNRRISNAKMLAELEVELAYPSYREGLASALANDSL